MNELKKKQNINHNSNLSNSMNNTNALNSSWDLFIDPQFTTKSSKAKVIHLELLELCEVTRPSARMPFLEVSCTSSTRYGSTACEKGGAGVYGIREGVIYGIREGMVYDIREWVVQSIREGAGLRYKGRGDLRYMGRGWSMI